MDTYFLLHARHCARYFVCIVSLNVLESLWSKYIHISLSKKFRYKEIG